MGTRYSAFRQKLFPSLPTPSSGEAVLGFKSDGLLYKKLSNGVETLLEGGAVPDRLAEGSKLITDWNAATQSGWYNSQTSGTTNVPDAATHSSFPYWLGYVTVYDGNWKKQRVWNLNTSAADTLTWERNQQSGTWGAWYKVGVSAQDISKVSGTVYNDSGWITFPYAAGWGAYGGWQTPQYRKIGQQVFMRGLLLRTSGNNATLGVLPAGFRPVVQELFGAGDQSDNAHVRINVTADGAVSVQAFTSTAVGGYVSLANISFFTGEQVNNLAGGMGGLSQQTYESSGWWGPGGVVGNSASIYTSVYTSTTTTATPNRTTANMAYVNVFIPAASGGNQAVNYYLQMSVNGGAYNQVGVAYQHNGGSAAINMDCEINSWVPFTPGASLAFRVFIVNAGGGTATYFGIANITLNYFVATAAATMPYDSGWTNVAFSNSFFNYNQGWQTCQYRREGNRVYMRGLAQRTSSLAAGADIFILPAGFRPPSQVTSMATYYVGSGSEITYKLNLYPGGNVQTALAITGSGYVFIDGYFNID